MKKKKKATITNLNSEELNELRQLIEELDLIPLAIYPKELRPLALDYLKSIENDNCAFDNPVEKIITSEYMRNRKKVKPIKDENQLILILD